MIHLDIPRHAVSELLALTLWVELDELDVEDKDRVGRNDLAEPTGPCSAGT